MPSFLQYKAFHVLDGTPCDSLPYTNVNFGNVLNSTGSFSGQLSLADPAVQNMNWADATVPGRTMLCIDYLGTIVWGGLITSTNYQESSNAKQLSVTAQTFHWWAAQRLQVFDYSTTWAVATDPVSICTRIVRDALGGSFTGTNAGCNLGARGINIASHGATAPAISVTYPGTQLQSLDSIISTLSQMGYGAGFDYSWDVSYDVHAQPQITLNFWYPRQGVTFATSGLTVRKQQALDWSYTEDSSQQMDSVFMVGSSTSAVGGTVPVEGIASSVIADGWPLLERAVSHVQINDESVLIGVATGLLGQSCWPVVTPTLTLPLPAPDPAFAVYPDSLDPSRLTLGQFDVGDDLTFVIDPLPSGVPPAYGIEPYLAENTSPRFPNGTSFNWRIAQWKATIPAQGMPTILLDLAPPPGSNFPPPAPPHS